MLKFWYVAGRLNMLKFWYIAGRSDVFVSSCGWGFPLYSVSSKNFVYKDFVKHFVKSKDTGVTQTKSGKN